MSATVALRQKGARALPLATRARARTRSVPALVLTVAGLVLMHMLLATLVLGYTVIALLLELGFWCHARVRWAALHRRHRRLATQLDARRA